MQYVNLGSSGLKVSRLSYGNWVNSKGGQSDIIDECVQWCYDHGVNFFDTAEAYSGGDGERQISHAIKKLGIPRHELVVTTKLFWGVRPDSNLKCNYLGTSRKHLMEGMNTSLGLLDMEYVDVVFLHRFDHTTPMRETLLAMKDILDSGKAHYWGTSEWPAVRIMQAMHMCDELKMPRPTAEQCQYSMLERTKMEFDYGILFDEYGLGTTIWSPLASGVLTGKYNDGIPEGSRFDTSPELKTIYDRHLGPENREATLKKLNAVADIAKSLDATMAQLALAWCLAYDNVSTILVGASKVSQLEDNFKALEVVKKLTPEILTQMNEILGNRPVQEANGRTFQPLPNRRN